MSDKPKHIWRGSEDGHDCIDCEPDSIWKCDVLAHFIDPYLLLGESQRQKLLDDLRAMATARRLQRTDMPI